MSAKTYLSLVLREQQKKEICDNLTANFVDNYDICEIFKLLLIISAKN